MKKAHPLNSVLKLRTLAEEQEERLLERMLAESAKIDDLVRRDQEVIRATYYGRENGGQFIHASEVQASYAHVSELTERIHNFEEQKQKILDLANQQRSVLQRAQQQRETVESLLDQHWSRVDLLERRREQRTLDDIHGAQRIRKALSAT